MALHNGYDFLIQWHLTERCNLRCSHCYQTGDCGPELTLDEIRSGLDEIEEMFWAWSDTYSVPFAPSFNITGGEPLLRGDLLPVLEDIRKRGFESFLLTNGTLVDRSTARRLMDAGIKGVQVSIEGCEDVHDMIRGDGSFLRTAEGIEHLLDAGHIVTLNMTLSRLNEASAAKVVTFASHIGAQRVGFSRLIPSGRAATLAGEMLSPSSVKALYDSLFSLDIAHLEIVSGDPIASQYRLSRSRSGKKPEPDSVPCGGCSAGVAGLTILADGTIVPCRRLPIPLGNLREDALRDVWAQSPVLEALRDKKRYQGRCGTCDRWDACRGCRAVAYAAARARGVDDFLAEDPQCFLLEG